ncbi:MAG: hypothetical protein EHM42_04875 [Planctomycetaceae bacterium]|nr:MAG: hypothetical protein EHM42_04875 [Planctomycetaceae bacterium]
MLRLRSKAVRWALALGAGACLTIGLLGWRWVYVTWQLRVARAQLEMGSTLKVQSALKVLNAAQSVERPERPELLFQMGRALRRSGDLDTAFAYLRRAQLAGWPPREVDEQTRLAMIQRGRFEDEAHPLSELLARDVADVNAYELYEAMAKGYLHSYRFDDALRCLSFWIDWRPRDVDPRLWRAGIWEFMCYCYGDNEEYRQILEFDPDNLEARLAVARILMESLNQVSEAQQELERCLKLSPDNVGALLGLAECERRLSDPVAAEARLRALFQRSLTPEELASAQLQLGQVLLERRELDEARELLTKVVEADPLNGTAHYTLGLVYASEGRQEEATRQFERSRSLEEQFNRLIDIQTELLTHPEQVNLRWEAGKILMDQGMHRDGAAWMATALMYEPDHQKTHESLAEYYETVRPDRQLAAHHREKARLAGAQNRSP